MSRSMGGTGPFYRLQRENTGAVSVEFALILPVMLVMYLGTYEATNLVRAYLATNRTAQLLANLVAQEGTTGLTTADSTDFCKAAKLALSPFSTAGFSATIASITKSLSSGAIAFDWQDTSCGGGAGVISNAAATANGLLTTNGDTMIVVKATYAYSAAIHLVLPASYSIQQTAYQRPRTGNTVPQG